jgi:hypothetical protein
MRQRILSLSGALLVLAVLLATHVVQAAPPAHAAKAGAPAHGAKAMAPRYLIAGDEFEGCECSSVCPCIWSSDATFDECRGLSAWTIKQGHYEGTDLKGLSFAAALTKTGKNLEKSMGQWEGVLFVPESATPAQQQAIETIMKAEMGSGFAKMEVKPTHIEISGKPGSQELKIGTVAHLKVAAIRGPNGQVPKIVNAPSPIALPVIYCAKSEVDTYQDGTNSWDFAGHNSFYGPFEMKAKP